MTTKLSIIEEVGEVRFPAWEGKRLYMLEFTPEDVPKELLPYSELIEQMTAGISFSRGFFTLDEKVLTPRVYPRRPGLHVDGNWDLGHHVPPLRHGPARSHIGTPYHPGHTGTPGPGPQPRHRGLPARHIPGTPSRHRGTGGEQLLVLASTLFGCDAFQGEWESQGPFNGGDCSYVDLRSLEKVTTRPGVAYVGGACSMLHESIPSPVIGLRSFARLNLEAA